MQTSLASNPPHENETAQRADGMLFTSVEHTLHFHFHGSGIFALAAFERARRVQQYEPPAYICFGLMFRRSQVFARGERLEFLFLPNCVLRAVFLPAVNFTAGRFE